MGVNTNTSIQYSYGNLYSACDFTGGVRPPPPPAHLLDPRSMLIILFHENNPMEFQIDDDSDGRLLTLKAPRNKCI